MTWAVCATQLHSISVEALSEARLYRMSATPVAALGRHGRRGKPLDDVESTRQPCHVTLSPLCAVSTLGWSVVDVFGLPAAGKATACSKSIGGGPRTVLPEGSRT